MSDISRLDSDGSTELPVGDQIDRICDAFEAAWAKGDTPLIEDYLHRCEVTDRERLLLELVLVDREYRVRRGDVATRQDYRSRFPEFAAAIDDLEFSTIDERRDGRQWALRRHSTLNTGSKIAHFELLEELGRGASGTVWKARDLRLHRIVAVKVPRDANLTAAERERFLREGQACAQLRHPNIVAVYEVGEVHGSVFIVTEYIDGMDLRNLLSRDRPSVRAAAELTAQLAEALHHAHEQGIVHRDLKPANVLVDGDGRPHITDFGLAKWSASSSGMTIDGNILGTPAYMAPEQARGDVNRVDRRSDVYGLSTLLYEMLSERPPFQGDVSAIIHQVVCTEPIRPRKINPSIPRDLETVCLKGMEKDPARRYASTQEMAVDLRRYLRGVPIFARRASMLERSWRLVRRHPIAAAIVFGLLSVVAIAGSTILSLQQKNYQLEGKRPVRIITEPPGARVALVPIDEQTGEPSVEPAGIIRPSGVTPLSTVVKSGSYLVEAALADEGNCRAFAEVYRTVPRLDASTRGHQNHKRDVYTLAEIKITQNADVLAGMVRVPIDENLRHDNPLLPRVLWVDAAEADQEQNVDSNGHERKDSADRQRGKITFDEALSTAEFHGKRLASAAEYDAITTYIKRRDASAQSGGEIDDLFDGVAEWTTTRSNFHGKGPPTAVAQLRSMVALKGYGDPDAFPDFVRWTDGQLLAPPETVSAKIGCRFVRSGEPRFIKP